MAARYIVRKRSRYPLVFLEIAGISLFFAYRLCKHYGWDWIVGLGIFVACTVLIARLFFVYRIIRYIFSIVFSLFWGFLAYGFATGASKSELSYWVAFLLAFLISLALHHSYFYVNKQNDEILY